MPGCNPAFGPDKKPEVNKNRMLVFFITSRPVTIAVVFKPHHPMK
jgi:hypothetical protein